MSNNNPIILYTDFSKDRLQHTLKQGIQQKSKTYHRQLHISLTQNPNTSQQLQEQQLNKQYSQQNSSSSTNLSKNDTNIIETIFKEVNKFSNNFNVIELILENKELYTLLNPDSLFIIKHCVKNYKNNVNIQFGQEFSIMFSLYSYIQTQQEDEEETKNNSEKQLNSQNSLEKYVIDKEDIYMILKITQIIDFKDTFNIVDHIQSQFKNTYDQFKLHIIVNFDTIFFSVLKFLIVNRISYEFLHLKTEKKGNFSIIQTFNQQNLTKKIELTGDLEINQIQNQVFSRLLAQLFELTQSSSNIQSNFNKENKKNTQQTPNEQQNYRLNDIIIDFPKINGFKMKQTDKLAYQIEFYKESNFIISKEYHKIFENILNPLQITKLHIKFHHYYPLLKCTYQILKNLKYLTHIQFGWLAQQQQTYKPQLQNTLVNQTLENNSLRKSSFLYNNNNSNNSAQNNMQQNIQNILNINRNNSSFINFSNNMDQNAQSVLNMNINRNSDIQGINIGQFGGQLGNTFSNNNSNNLEIFNNQSDINDGDIPIIVNKKKFNSSDMINDIVLFFISQEQGGELLILNRSLQIRKNLYQLYVVKQYQNRLGFRGEKIAELMRFFNKKIQQNGNKNKMKNTGNMIPSQNQGNVKEVNQLKFRRSSMFRFQM